MRPFFRVVKDFNKKAVRRTNPWEFGQGGRGSEWYKKNDENSCVCEDFCC